MKTKHLS